ncbi:MAG: PLP-dependent aminotransferase family protein [Candidatus Latescibacterota bacterium]
MPRYDFGSGRPAPETFPTEELAEAAARAVRQLGGQLVLYPGDLGHVGLRQVAARRESEREGVPVSPEHISLTNGSMQGVTLVAEALTRGPGDVVVLEELNYSGTLAAYRRLGLELAGVPVDGEGMRMDALEETLLRLQRGGRSAAFIYTLTTYHNPTGAVMPVHRRRELLRLAARFDTVVVEDNCYGDVRFEGDVPPALYALEDSPRIVYLGSFSKILGAGLRLGYLLARPPMLGRLLERRFDGGNSALAAAICAEVFASGVWTHAERANALLRRKRDAVLGGLQECALDLCTWSRPPGGLFIWVGFPPQVDGQRLWQVAQEEGVTYARGSAFHARALDIPYLRLAFGYPSLEEIGAGIPRLAACIRRCACTATAR